MTLQDMTVAQLRAEAARLGAPVQSKAKKAEIIAAIEAAQAKQEPIEVHAEVIDEEQPEEELRIVSQEGTIEANFAALDERINAMLAKYEGWEPSADCEEDVKQCERERKYLNAIANDLDARRKTVKAQYEAPLKKFEQEANAIRDKIKGVAKRLDGIVKEAKEAEQQLKYDALRQHYEEFAEFLAPVVPYSQIHDPKWLNKKPVLPKCIEELEAKVSEIAAQWENLKQLNLEFYDEAEAQFFRTLSLGAAIDYNAKLVEDRRKIEEMKANMEAYSAPEPEPYEYEHAQCCEAAPEPVSAEVSYEPEQVPAQPEPAPYVQPQPAPVAAPAYVPPVSKPEPCVMVIEAATVEQMQAIGKFCGSLTPPVTGVFKGGTLRQIFEKGGW